MKKKYKSSVYKTIPALCIVPLFLFGILMMAICGARLSTAMHQQAEGRLQAIADSILLTYDTMYPGDYRFVKSGKVAAFYKGEKEITGEYEYLDRMKAAVGAEITFFYQDTRMITTMKDAEGNRLVGTGANSIICRDVLEKDHEEFYHNMQVGDGYYLGYYRPLHNEDGRSIGMLAVSMPADEVHRSINRVRIPLIVLIILGMLLTGLFASVYVRKLVFAMNGVQRSLSSVAKGELDHEPGYEVMSRNDEIAEMGRMIIVMQNSLRKLIERDALTELYNRRYANVRLQNMFERAREEGTECCVIMGDVDYFKRINDTYGHDTGDVVLKEIGRVMKQNLAGKSFAARWGGEEFLLVYGECSLEEGVSHVQKLAEIISGLEILSGSGETIKLTMTFGVTSTDGESSPEEVIRIADERLYAGKEAGRNRIVAEGSVE